MKTKVSHCLPRFFNRANKLCCQAYLFSLAKNRSACGNMFKQDTQATATVHYTIIVTHFGHIRLLQFRRDYGTRLGERVVTN